MDSGGQTDNGLTIQREIYHYVVEDNAWQIVSYMIHSRDYHTADIVIGWENAANCSIQFDANDFFTQYLYNI